MATSYAEMVEPAAAEIPDPKPWRFILGYGAAQTGAFICFIPLLTTLLPGKAEMIGGADKAVLLGQVAMIGGLVAAIGNLLFGMLSDRTQGRFGRRRPWIVAGLAGVAVSMVLISRADGPVGLLVAVIVFQLAVNAVYAPLTALVPDVVPDSRKGLVSAWAGIALPVATLFTALAIVPLAGAIAWQFGLVVAAAGLLILPFAVTLREPRRPAIRKRLSASLEALKDRNFSLAFASRLLMEGAVAIHTLYLLFFLQGRSAGLDGRAPAQAFALLLIVGTVAATTSGFLGGVASDRLRSRRPLVIAGGLCMAGGLGLLVSGPVWPALLAAQLLFGVGHGLHATTVAAMTAEILPHPEAAGRDLGVMNIAIALPQSLAPAVAAALLGLGATLGSVFAVASLAALAACLALLPMRRKPAADQVPGFT
ncbi:MAG: MFS transporter [Brevundimonas sp.]|nr:MAG: MFS transporter [Brevundimonas sp.]